MDRSKRNMSRSRSVRRPGDRGVDLGLVHAAKGIEGVPVDGLPAELILCGCGKTFDPSRLDQVMMHIGH